MITSIYREDDFVFWLGDNIDTLQNFLFFILVIMGFSLIFVPRLSLMMIKDKLNILPFCNFSTDSTYMQLVFTVGVGVLFVVIGMVINNI